MTLRRHLRNLIAGVAVLFLAASSTLASTFNLPYAGTVGGTHIEAGHYKVTWEEHSADVTVTLIRGKEVVATAKGRMESRATKYQRNMVVYSTKGDGSQSISELRVGGTNTAIVFSD